MEAAALHPEAGDTLQGWYNLTLLEVTLPSWCIQKWHVSLLIFSFPPARSWSYFYKVTRYLFTFLHAWGWEKGPLIILIILLQHTTFPVVSVQGLLRLPFCGSDWPYYFYPTNIIDSLSSPCCVSIDFDIIKSFTDKGNMFLWDVWY